QGGIDVITATDGANIAGVNGGGATTAETLSLTGGITMTLAQHEAMSISAGGGNETGANVDTVTLTTAGTFTGQGDVETYVLANATGNVFTQVDGNVSVKGGTSNDRIITSAVDAVRSSLTVDLSAGGRDTVEIRNGEVTSVPSLIDNWTSWDGFSQVPANETDAEGGAVLNGFIASTRNDPDIIDPNATGATQDRNFTGTYGQSVSDWNGTDGTYAVTITGFTAGDVDGADVIESFWGAVDLSNAIFVENAVLNQTDLTGVASGSVIELDATQTFQLVNYANLAAVAALLSNSGDGDALLGLNDGFYTVIFYRGTGGASAADPADAYIYQITVDEGDGLDFVSNEWAGNYDADSIELVGILVDIGANTLAGQNFA
ncbi:hypothetical protein, partial [Quisquiliibacterium transsilvanicum]